MRTERAIIREYTYPSPPKTSREHALFKKPDIGELSLALHEARVNADFPLIEAYCRWVAETARIDLFVTGVNCGGRIVDGAGRGLVFQATFNSAQLLGIYEKALISLYTQLVHMYAYTPYFETLFDSKVMVSENGPSRVINKKYVFLGGIARESFFGFSFHEAGHALFHSIKTTDKKTKIWFSDFTTNWYLIDKIAHWQKLFDLVKDSNFEKNSPTFGHPADNPGELFASSIHAFCLHANQFSTRILTTQNQNKQRFGRLIWTFLRDELFSGKAFLPTDPFAHISWQDELRYFEQSPDTTEILAITKQQLDMTRQQLIALQNGTAKPVKFPPIFDDIYIANSR